MPLTSLLKRESEVLCQEDRLPVIVFTVTRLGPVYCQAPRVGTFKGPSRPAIRRYFSSVHSRCFFVFTVL